MGLLDIFKRDRTPAVVAAPAAPTPTRAQHQLTYKVAARKFQAAERSRMNYNWQISDAGINQEIFRALRTLRMMSRDLVQNNPLGKKFLTMVGNNVVGPNGFTLQMLVKDDNGKPDKEANKSVSDAFYDWSKCGVCEVSGQFSFPALCRAIVKTLARDGECLLIEHQGKTVNKFGFALQLLDIDRLDINKNVDDGVGNPIRMGVEYDRQTLRPLFYHILESHPTDGYSGFSHQSGHKRMKADYVHHLFLPDRAEQLRGYPWFHAVITTVHDTGEYEDSAIKAARIGASKMGFYETPDGQADALAEGEDEDGELFESAEAGVFNAMPAGVKFHGWDPKYPHEMFGEFMKEFVRKISSGLDVSYHSLGNNLESVNFSSIRSGTLDERDMWMAIQGWFAEHFLERMFPTWLKYSLLLQAIKTAKGAALPLAKFDKFNNASWQGRRWQWVDPKSDMTAAATAYALRIKSLTQIAQEQGLFFEDVAAQIAEELSTLKQLGISMPVAATAKGVSNNDDNNQEGDEDGSSKKNANQTDA